MNIVILQITYFDVGVNIHTLRDGGNTKFKEKQSYLNSAVAPKINR